MSRYFDSHRKLNKTKTCAVLFSIWVLLVLSSTSSMGQSPCPDKIAPFIKMLSELFQPDSGVNRYIQLSTYMYEATVIVGYYDWNISESKYNDPDRKEVLHGFLGFGMDDTPDRITFKGKLANEKELEMLRKRRKELGVDWISKLPKKIKGKTVRYGPNSEVELRKSLVKIQPVLEEFFQVKLTEPEVIFDFTDRNIMEDNHPFSDDLTWRVTYFIPMKFPSASDSMREGSNSPYRQVLELQLEPFDGRIICIFHRK